MPGKMLPTICLIKIECTALWVIRYQTHSSWKLDIYTNWCNSGHLTWHPRLRTELKTITRSRLGYIRTLLFLKRINNTWDEEKDPCPDSRRFRGCSPESVGDSVIGPI